MDGTRLDYLARSFVSGTSRRQSIKAIAAAVVGGALLVGGQRRAGAASLWEPCSADRECQTPGAICRGVPGNYRCACPNNSVTCTHLGLKGCFLVDRDENHCGGCGKRCGTNQTCADGECICPGGKAACVSGQKCCTSGRSCVDGRCLRT